MAQGINTGTGIIGVVILVIGLIMVIIGIILLAVYHDSYKPWVVWLLLGGGVILAIIGIIIIAIATSAYDDCREYPGEKCRGYRKQEQLTPNFAQPAVTFSG